MKTATDYWFEKFDENPTEDSEKLAVVMMWEYADAVTPKWISVDERLPEESDQFVLVANNEGVFATTHRYIKKHNHWVAFDSPFVNLTVTHWMPLPAPPTTKGAQG